MATNTLVQKLQEVDIISDFVEVNKKENIKKLLEEARKKYALIDQAVRGNTSIPDVVERLYDKYRNWRLLLPRFKDKEYDKQLDKLDLGELLRAEGFRTDNSQRLAKEMPYIGRFVGWFYDKLANPIVLSLLMGGLVSLMGAGGQGRFESEIANYSAQFGLGAFLGLFVGSLATMFKYNEISIAREQAKYLQAKIQNLRPYM